MKNDKQEGILFTIDCLNNQKYNFDYNLEYLIKEARQLQSNWNSLRELIIKRLDKYDRLVSKEEGIEIEILMWVRDKMNELEGKDKNE